MDPFAAAVDASAHLIVSAVYAVVAAVEPTVRSVSEDQSAVAVAVFVTVNDTVVAAIVNLFEQ